MIRHILALTALLVALGPSALAQEEGKKKQTDRRPAKQEVIKKYDKNGDGKLDEAERKAMREDVGRKRGDVRRRGDAKRGDAKRGDAKRGDAKKGGEQKKGETRKGGETKKGEARKGPGARRGRDQVRGELIKKFDANGDGKLDDAERAKLRKHVEAERAKRKKDGEKTPPKDAGKRRGRRGEVKKGDAQKGGTQKGDAKKRTNGDG